MRMKRECQKRAKKKTELNLDAIDMREVLSNCGIAYTDGGKNVSNGWIGTQCPFPGCGDTSNHCGICLTSPVVSCYKCGRKGNYLSYLGVKLGNFGKAIDILESHTPRELRLYKKDENEFNVTKVNLPESASKKPSKMHTDYLKMRGFDPKELTTMYDLYFCKYGEWAERIIAPIYYRNKLVTFTSIDTNDDSYLRYKHLKKEESIIHTKNCLFGLEQCTGRNIVVVEGFFDKLRVGPGSVCTWGTIVTAHQKRLLADFSKAIILFDGDDAGRKAGSKLATDLSAIMEVELVTLDDGIDPDEMSKSDLKQIQQMIKTRW